MTDSSNAPSHWLAETGEVAFPASANLPSESEVAIIGGGIMGTATAYWLTRSGVRAVLVEANQLAWGASGRNAGMMLAGSRALEDPRLVQSVMEEERIEAEYQNPGHLALASSEAVWEKICEEADRKANTTSPVYALDRFECEGLLELHLHPRYLGGRWLPSGGVIHPTRYVAGLAKAAAGYGATFVTRAPVSSVEAVTGLDGFEIETGKGRLYARQVVFACQAGLSRFLPDFLEVIMPLRGQVMATQPMPRLFKTGMAVDWGTLYWRQARDGVIVLGGLRSLDPQTETSDQLSINQNIQEALERFLPEAFPGFPPVRAERRWAGIMDEPVDGRPVIGALPDRPNQWIIAGFGGHGMPAGLGAGKALAEAILSGRTPETLAPYDPGRFNHNA